ncbi:MAG: hypothetical protein AYP45_02960 [Candidatus Brocadia carolinensis]|uniref:Uncharacterized protein n=1 Tax=Candidatus Brocadia carolinensis TaxID=1004156 RepID=A0A1V4AWK5_9BACT|nr:MAG: hypothetical protein AYP45_02960 [Candidatus Brocadia caroliniensis]
MQETKSALNGKIASNNDWYFPKISEVKEIKLSLRALAKQFQIRKDCKACSERISEDSPAFLPFPITDVLLLAMIRFHISLTDSFSAVKSAGCAAMRLLQDHLLNF